MKTQHTKIMECSKSSINRKVYNEKCLREKLSNSSKSHLTLYLKELKKRTSKPKVSRRI